MRLDDSTGKRKWLLRQVRGVSLTGIKIFWTHVLYDFTPILNSLLNLDININIAIVKTWGKYSKRGKQHRTSVLLTFNIYKLVLFEFGWVSTLLILKFNIWVLKHDLYNWNSWKSPAIRNFESPMKCWNSNQTIYANSESQ